MSEIDDRAPAVPPATADAVVTSVVLRRASWGGIFAGGFVTLAVWLMLTLLGVGIGLKFAQPSAAALDAGAIGVDAAAWWVGTGLLSMIFGGFVAARLGARTSGWDGVLHGVTTWAVSLLVVFYLLTAGVGNVVGGAFNMVGTAVSKVGKSAVHQVTPAVGLSSDQMKTQVEDLLHGGQGTNPQQMSAKQAQTAIVRLVPKVLAGGRDAAQARQRIVAIMAAQLKISPQEANQHFSKWEADFKRTKHQATRSAKQAADKTATAVSRAAIWGFVALLLGALAGAFGGVLGTRRRRILTVVR